MAGKADTEASGFGSPSRYRIVVVGELPAHWCDRVAGMTIRSCRKQAGNQRRTTLEGRLLDQAQLRGVLETLYSHHCTILSINQLDDSDSES